MVSDSSANRRSGDFSTLITRPELGVEPENHGALISVNYYPMAALGEVALRHGFSKIKIPHSFCVARDGRCRIQLCRERDAQATQKQHGITDTASPISTPQDTKKGGSCQYKKLHLSFCAIPSQREQFLNQRPQILLFLVLFNSMDGIRLGPKDGSAVSFNTLPYSSIPPCFFHKEHRPIVTSTNACGYPPRLI